MELLKLLESIDKHWSWIASNKIRYKDNIVWRQ